MPQRPTAWMGFSGGGWLPFTASYGVWRSAVRSLFRVREEPWPLTDHHLPNYLLIVNYENYTEEFLLLPSSVVF